MKPTLIVAAIVLATPLAALAQVQRPIQQPVPVVPSVPAVPSVPGMPSRNALLAQTNGVVADLMALKSSGKLAADQAGQVDALLPKATSMLGELENPQLQASRLRQLGTDLATMQGQVTALKAQVWR